MPKRQAILLAAILLLIGCAGTKKSRPTERPTSPEPKVQSTNLLNEDFDPLSLKEPEFRIPPKKSPEETEAQPATAAPAADTSLVQVVGYQVQIMQTEEASLARKVVREAAVALETSAEIIFDSPYFKVRGGSFVNRYDAEQLQELAASKGYAGAWVVRTTIKVRASELERQ